MVADLGTTSGVERPENPLLRTRKLSSIFFACANGGLTKSTEVAQVEHDLRPPARKMNVSPSITSASLAGTGKYADADYATVFLKHSVEVFDLENTKIFVSKETILRGHKCKDDLYRISLWAADAESLNTRPMPDASPPEDYPTLNAIPPEDYNAKTMLVSIPPLSKPKETIQNVCELRTQREMVRYYHAAAGFPVKATWVKTIANNQYA